MGVNHSTQGAVTVAAINNLALITGNHWPRRRLTLFHYRPVQRHGHARSRLHFQLCPAIANSTIGEPIEPISPRCGTSTSIESQPRAGWPIPTLSKPRSTGKIKALWFIATNPAVSFPNYELLQQALRSVEFIVVQDGFHPTPTSDFAHLVLPAAIWGEKEGTYTNSERRISKANVLVAPPGEARTDFDIFLALAEKLGVKEELYPGWQSTHDAFQEWQRVSAGRMCDYSSFTWQQIEDNGGMQWGGEHLYTDAVFPTATGKAILHSVPCLPFIEQPDRDYDLILNTGRTVEHWHTRTKTAQVEMLESMVPNAWLEMNPVDAVKLQLKPHDRVTIVLVAAR